MILYVSHRTITTIKDGSKSLLVQITFQNLSQTFVLKENEGGSP